jgi:hypothetical protein
VTDHEHTCEQLSPTVLEAVHGVDILIHDAQYSRDELRQGKQSWGHSAWEDWCSSPRKRRSSSCFCSTTTLRPPTRP